MFKYLRRLAVGVGGAFALCVLWVPVTAQAASAPVAPTASAVQTILSGTYTYAQIQALKAQFARLPAPTAAQLAAGMAYAKAHPFEGSVKALPAPRGHNVRPLVGGGLYWWGAQVTLTNNDVHNIITIILTTGLSATAGVLCALINPFLGVVCAIFGGLVGYFIAEIIWNNIGQYFTGSGVYFNFSYYSGWNWGTW